MTLIFIIIYNILFFIVLLFAIPFSFFFKKYRSPFWYRFFVNRKLKKWRQIYKNDNVISIHCASYGEYEHIKPFIRELKSQKQDIKICVQFFSASGYKNVSDNAYIDLKVYTPFDNIISQYTFFKHLSPLVHIYAKYDVWPNEIFSLKLLGIKKILINASLAENSKRFTRFKFFHQQIYCQFDAIYTVTEKDAKRFRRYFGIEKNLRVLGDTKNDQVLYRSIQAVRNPLFPQMSKSNDLILVAGSIWPEDWEKIGPSILELLSSFHKFKVVLCPHEMSKEFIEKLASQLDQYHPVLFSQTDTVNLLCFPRVTIIDMIGKLADLYSYGQMAFVGGSYKGKVHNVLEPAIYGIPVLTGPFIKNSSEALQLKNDGLIELSDNENLCYVVEDLIQNPEKITAIGTSAKEHVTQNLGISGKLCREFSDMNIL